MAELSIWVIAACVLAAFIAGFVDAVAGGGGLIQLPVLLAVFPSLPLATVSGTNKSVSVVGTSAAAATYARRLPVRTSTVVPMALCAFAGSAAGAALVTRVNRAQFEPALIVLLIGVIAFTMLRPDIGATSRPAARGPVAACLLGTGIGFYDGIMGPGTGMFLVLGLVSVLGSSFLAAAGMAKVVNVATNLAALVVFVPGNHVLWAATAVMAPANLLGGVVGARTALNRGSAFVRLMFLGVIALLLARLVFAVARA